MAAIGTLRKELTTIVGFASSVNQDQRYCAQSYYHIYCTSIYFCRSPEIWFDDVDEFFIDKGQKETIVTDAEDTIKNGERTPETDNELVKPESYKG